MNHNSEALLRRLLRDISIILLAMSVAVVFRKFLLGALEASIPWVTFFPVVMIASLYGGWLTGLLSAGASCLIVLYAWPLFGDHPFIKDFGDRLGMFVFLFNCAMVSVVAEVARRGRERDAQANEELERKVSERTAAFKIANNQLQSELAKRKQMEKKARESKEKLSLILNSTAEAIYGLDQMGNCIFCNPACIRILGYQDENDLIGKNIHDVIHHTKADGTPYPKEECIIIKASQNGEYIHNNNGLFWRADNKGVPAEYWAYPILKDGKVTGAVVSFIDITEREALENQLRQSQKMEAIGQLAGGVAHDFNNILTAIIGYGSLALMKIAKDDPERLNIEHILQGAEKASHLTKDLLLFSRKQVSERKCLDLNEIIRKTEKFLTMIVGEDISCKTLLHSGAVPVLADEHQLEQVLMNLATNGRDAMPNGGTFSITTEPIRFDQEFITAHGYGQPGMFALITVSDTGEGMDKDTQQRIFEPFFTTKGMGKDTGLGLSIVYGIVKGHDGYINIYSEPGVGTTFKIYLPMTTMEGEATTESIQPLPLGKGETILIAEDEPEVRNILRLTLEAYGYRVIEAENGNDAVTLYRDNMDKISLILLDVIMPVKNGWAACKEIKSLKPDTKVIFMSGYTSDVIAVKGMFEADADLISKPVTPDSLLRKIREVLDK
ncbi:MAG: ATP-binding protein [Dissulfurispiraceae bacterium]|jgi:PAS domain S-box-containing protein